MLTSSGLAKVGVLGLEEYSASSDLLEWFLLMKLWKSFGFRLDSWLSGAGEPDPTGPRTVTFELPAFIPGIW